MHSETVGMVVDRLALYSTAAHTALTANTTAWDLHCAWQRLAEIALAYDDLVTEIAKGRRRIPEFTAPAMPLVGGAR